MEQILKNIKENADYAYKAFQSKLLPGIDGDKILGLRAPGAQRIAKKYAGTLAGYEFLNALPHRYYDENIVHALILGNLKCGFEELRERIVSFLPYVDNWAVCDGLCAHLKQFFNNREKAYELVLSCLDLSVYGEKSSLSPVISAYTIRFGLVCLLNYYIDPEHIEHILKICLNLSPLCQSQPTPASYSYYVSMALAWLVSFCLIKEYDRTIHIIEEKSLNKWVHNKSIQKALESYRIDQEKKSYLRGLKQK